MGEGLRLQTTGYRGREGCCWVRDYRKLKAFGCADSLALVMYRATAAFPLTERFGLTSQLRRGVVSVASNIVEGSARSTQREYLRFIEIAYGSATEVAYQFSLAERLGFVSSDPELLVQTRGLIDETARTLAGLVRYLGTDPAGSVL